MKTKDLKEAQFLSLLQKVLPKATNDPHLASAIYDEVAKEVRLMKSIESFEKFCEKGAIPDMEPQTVTDLKNELATKFGEENIVLVPDEEGKDLAVEITLPDRTLSSRVKIDPTVKEEEVKVPFVPFPVALPSDPELVWLLGRHENLGPDEAARAIFKIEEEFWATKKGQELQRKGTEKTFAEFITHVPSTALTESGLKRHYKEPEALKALHLIPGGGAASVVTAETSGERSTAAKSGSDRSTVTKSDSDRGAAIKDGSDTQPPW